LQERIVQLETNQQNMQATHEQHMAALGQHYQRTLLDLTTYLRA
jgi:hypothetical protein